VADVRGKRGHVGAEAVLRDLVCIGEWCEDNDVAPSAFSNWRARYEFFPRPIYSWSTVTIFQRTALDLWFIQHQEARR